MVRGRSTIEAVDASVRKRADKFIAECRIVYNGDHYVVQHKGWLRWETMQRSLTGLTFVEATFHTNADAREARGRWAHHRSCRKEGYWQVEK